MSDHYIPDPHEVAALREAGHSAAELADSFKVSVRTVYNWLKNAGWESEGTAPPSKCPPADVLRTLYLDQRKSCPELAKLFNANERTVRRWLAGFNISRPPGDNNCAAKPKPGKRKGSRSALARYNEDRPE